MCSVPKAWNSRAAAASMHRSAMRPTMNFLCAATTAAGRSLKKVSSRCSARLVAVQASASTSMWLVATTTATVASVAISQRT